MAGARWHDKYTTNFFQQSKQYVTFSVLITFRLFRKQDTNKRSQPPARVSTTSHMFPMSHIADKYHCISYSSPTTNISFVTSQPPARVSTTSHMFPMCHIADKYHCISCSSPTTNISFVTYVKLT